MRPVPLFTALVAAVACTQPEDPSQVLQGSWTMEAAHQSFEPVTLTLRQFGHAVLGEATISGWDPAGGGAPIVSVAGSYSSPAASLDVTGPTYSAHLSATMDRADHLVGVLTFSNAGIEGSDTVSYVRH